MGKAALAAVGQTGLVMPQRIFKTAQPATPVKVWKPGDFETNGHNLIVDWRDPAVLALMIGTDPEALSNIYQGTKGGMALARSDGTRYGAFLAETAGGARWYVKVSADLVKKEAK